MLFSSARNGCLIRFDTEICNLDGLGCSARISRWPNPSISIGNSSRMNMAEIIWAMNEKNNSLEDLVFYLRSYAVDYCTENGLACEFTLPENIPVKIIGGQVRRNIFLILKESLHNIVKHAGAKKVTISFQADENLSLIIADDGSGYKKAKHPNGNGLLSIEQRAKTLKGKFSISNNSGTVIHFEMPL